MKSGIISEVTEEMKNKVYDIIEQNAGKISKAEIQYEIRNNQIIYDNLYSSFVQRKCALDRITFLNYLLEVLSKLGL